MQPRYRRSLLVRFSLGCLFVTSFIARADTLITFEGLSNNSALGDFYPGISFNSRFVALIDSDAGGTGIFGGEPSAATVATITPGSTSAAVINIPAGFTSSLSLYYSGPGNTVLLFDQTDAQGSQLSLTSLPGTSSVNQFLPTTVNFSGTARSVMFGFVDFGAQQTFVDDVRLGAVPEPGSLGLGLAALGAIWATQGLIAVCRGRQRARLLR